MKQLPYGAVYFNDLLGECIAEGLGCAERGVLFTLLWLQHMAGSIPADPRAIRRHIGADATLMQIRTVIDLFFPLTADGERRANAKHAEAREKSRLVYEAKVSGGHKGAARRWHSDRTPTGSPIGSPNSNQNQMPHSSPPISIPLREVVEHERPARRSQR